MTYEEPTIEYSRGRRFESTQWSLVISAAHRSSPEGARAFALLCEKYWYPLYAHARRLEPHVENAKDLTQGFFALAMEKNYIADADPTRGRFRTFLLTSFSNYVSNQRDRSGAIKRGGSRVHVSLELEDAEKRYRQEREETQTPEKLFTRRWAIAVLSIVLNRLREEYIQGGKESHFDELKQFLTPGETDEHRAIGERLGMSEGAVKVAVSRLRSRYRERLCEEIADTTSNPQDIDDEIRCLFEAFSRF